MSKLSLIVAMSLSTGILLAEDKPTNDALLAEASGALSRGRYKAAIAATDQLIKRDPKHFEANFYRALAHDKLKNFDQAIAGYTTLIQLDEKRALSGRIRADDRRGDARLKAGHMKQAIADFDAYLKRYPEDAPHHWRRGIAFYYADEFKRGVEQFEVHKTVNASDVENSVWHFLCNARLVGINKARAAIIPLAGRDGRVPMMAVYDMFAGKATPAQVIKATETGERPARQSEPPLFYAHLYIGLYHEADGKHDLARKHMELAANKYTSPYYMGDVARVHLKLLNQKQDAKKTK